MTVLCMGVAPPRYSSPDSFRHYGEFFPGLGMRELVERYAVTGGIPKYIELFDDSGDIFEAIESNVLNRSGVLYDEPMFLLRGEVPEVGTYFSMIKVIAAGNRKAGADCRSVAGAGDRGAWQAAHAA